ncbi:Zinc finger MYM-type protein 1 [Linum perenne]
MPSAHIDRVLERVSRAEVEKHRLRLKTTIKVLQRLALQGCAFRGHDESESSLNRGNLIEWIEFRMEWREDVKAVVLKNAPGDAKYISPLIQKELLSVMANQVRCKIREEVGDAYFSILVDEARDESGREQMAIILRYVTSNGILTERFFAIKSVVNTSAATLKQVISDALSEYNLQVEKLRGQGYDGASNMSDQFNGLRALFLQDCPYAYFVHCFAHRLQLTLVAAAKYFNQCIDHQLSELNSRFNEDTIRLLQLSAALDPKDSFKAFNADHICELAEEFYPKDFDGHDILILKSELSLYTEHVVRNSEFEVSSLAKLMEKLVTRRLDVQYIMICRLIRLVLTLPVSTATTERAFSAMKIVKTDIRNKMGDDFLANSLMLFIERDYARKLDIDSIIDDFAKLKNRRVQLTINEG